MDSQASICNRKPITDFRRSLHFRFMKPIHEFLSEFEKRIGYENYANIKMNHWALGLIPFNIEAVYKCIAMEIPDEEPILSVNGFLGYYPSSPEVKEIQSFQILNIPYMFCILVETEQYVYECKPPTVFYDSSKQTHLTTYPDNMPSYHRYIDNFHTHFNNGVSSSGAICPYSITNTDTKEYYMRIYSRDLPYPVIRHTKLPSVNGTYVSPIVRIHPISTATTPKQIEEFLQSDYEELQEIRKAMGVVKSRVIVVYD